MVIKTVFMLDITYYVGSIPIINVGIEQVTQL